MLSKQKRKVVEGLCGCRDHVLLRSAVSGFPDVCVSRKVQRRTRRVGRK